MTRSCNGAGYLGRRWKVRYLALGLLILFLGLATRPASALDGVVLPDPEQQDLYLSLLQEFRCADCRNASLLEASGVQATEMRREIRGLIEDNQLDRTTQREAIDFARHLAIDAPEAAAMIASARREAGLVADSTVGPTLDAATRGVTGVAILVLLLNAVWFWYILGH